MKPDFVSTLSSHIGAPNSSILPIYVRVPKKGGRCSLTGLCRTHYYNAINGENPEVQSIVVRSGGSGRGVRLVVVASLLAWLDSHKGLGVAPTSTNPDKGSHKDTESSPARSGRRR